MVSMDKIIRKFIQLDEYLEVLKQIANTSLQDFLKDKIIIGSSKYYLQVSIECCLDVANHIIASEHFRAPTDYADSFKVIEEVGIIQKELGRKLQQMAKFRNRLVHLYGEIDNAFILDFISNDLKDLEAFKTIIINKYSSTK